MRRNPYLTPQCDLIHMFIFYFLDSPTIYFSNATFGTSVVFQMSVLERLNNFKSWFWTYIDNWTPCINPNQT